MENIFRRRRTIVGVIQFIFSILMINVLSTLRSVTYAAPIGRLAQDSSSAWLLAGGIITRAAIGQWVMQGASVDCGVNEKHLPSVIHIPVFEK
jgi:hypothetical protein